MKRTTIVVNDALVERAQQILGTRGLKATVDRALMEVIELDARRRAIAQLQAMDGLDLDREEIMANAWR
jgi:Arc/MetJ family transcription regulator